MRGGMYWTGDLGYRDEDGFFYFAGRNSDWLRVDGENFAAAPGRERAGPSPVGRAVRGVRGAGGRRGRRRDGGAAPARRPRRSTPTEFVDVPGRAGRPLAEVGAALRADQPRAAVDRDAEGAEARAAARALGDATTRCGGDPGAIASSGALTADDVGRAARAVRGAEPRPLARTSVSAARAASLCSLRHGDGTLPNCVERRLPMPVSSSRGNERARDAVRVEGVDDRAAVERAFGGVQERVRREDLLERPGQLERRADDRRAGDAARRARRARRAPSPIARASSACRRRASTSSRSGPRRCRAHARAAW